MLARFGRKHHEIAFEIIDNDNLWKRVNDKDLLVLIILLFHSSTVTIFNYDFKSMLMCKVITSQEFANKIVSLMHSYTVPSELKEFIEKIVVLPTPPTTVNEMDLESLRMKEKKQLDSTQRWLLLSSAGAGINDPSIRMARHLNHVNTNASLIEILHNTAKDLLAAKRAQTSPKNGLR